jgi:hypothetical protein
VVCTDYQDNGLVLIHCHKWQLDWRQDEIALTPFVQKGRFFTGHSLVSRASS